MHDTRHHDGTGNGPHHSVCAASYSPQVHLSPAVEMYNGQLTALQYVQMLHSLLDWQNRQSSVLQIVESGQRFRIVPPPRCCAMSKCPYGPSPYADLLPRNESSVRLPAHVKGVRGGAR